MSKVPITKNVFAQFAPFAFNTKEQWRSFNYHDYQTTRRKMQEQGTLSLGIHTGIMKADLTPLEIAYDSFLTADPRMEEVKRRAGILTVRNEPVLITGETGTGKEVIANILHGNREGRFTAINCGAVPPELFESELFGHEKGSFTGAHEQRTGRIEYATNGTLFIDEIGDMPLVLQVKLLRVLQQGTYQRVGGNEDRRCGCRFVFATHCDLEELARARAFRLDLLHRIQILRLHLTPLRERRVDIPSLALLYGVTEDKLKVFMDQLGAENPLSGNCRELQANILRFNLFGSVI